MKRYLLVTSILLLYLSTSALAANRTLRFTLTAPQETTVASVRAQVNLVRAERNTSAVAQNSARAAQEVAWATANTANIAAQAARVAENTNRAGQTPPLPPLPLLPNLTPLPAWTPVPLVPPFADNDDYLVDFILENINSWQVQEAGPEGVRRKFERADPATRTQVRAILGLP